MTNEMSTGRGGAEDATHHPRPLSHQFLHGERVEITWRDFGEQFPTGFLFF